MPSVCAWFLVAIFFFGVVVSMFAKSSVRAPVCFVLFVVGSVKLSLSLSLGLSLSLFICLFSVSSKVALHCLGGCALHSSLVAVLKFDVDSPG